MNKSAFHEKLKELGFENISDEIKSGIEKSQEYYSEQIMKSNKPDKDKWAALETIPFLLN